MKPDPLPTTSWSALLFLPDQAHTRDTIRAIGLSFAVILILFIAANSWLLAQIQDQQGKARYLRHAVRQRTIAQEISTASVRLAQTKDEFERASVSTTIAALVAKLQEKQSALTSGSRELSFNKPINQPIRDRLAAAGGILARLASKVKLQIDEPNSIERSEEVQAAIVDFSASMFSLTDLLETQTESSITQLALSIIWRTIIFILMLLGVWWFIIYPRLQNIRKRYEMLQTFQRAIEHAGEHMVITDPDGRILYANAAAERITGFSRQMMLGKKAGGRELWGGLMPTEFYENLWQKIKHDRQIFTGQVTNRRKNGERYTAETMISPTLDARGQVLYYLGIEREINPEK